MTFIRAVRGMTGKVGDVVRGIAAVLMGIYFVTLAFAVFDWGFLKGEITAYPIHCEELTGTGGCKKVGFTLRTTTYKPYAESQEVVYWVEGFPPEKLTQCAIRDTRNWSCKYNDGSAQFGFTGGRYWEITLIPGVTDDFGKKTIYVSRWHWLKESCGGNWKVFFLCAPLMAFLDE